MISHLKECAFRGRLTFLVGRENVSALAKAMSGDVVEIDGLKVSRLPNVPDRFLRWSCCQESYLGSAVIGGVPYHDIYGCQGPPIEVLQWLSLNHEDAEFYLTFWCSWVCYGPVRGRMVFQGGKTLAWSYEVLAYDELLSSSAVQAIEIKADWIMEYENSHQQWVTQVRSAALLCATKTELAT